MHSRSGFPGSNSGSGFPKVTKIRIPQGVTKVQGRNASNSLPSTQEKRNLHFIPFIQGRDEFAFIKVTWMKAPNLLPSYVSQLSRGVTPFTLGKLGDACGLRFFGNFSGTSIVVFKRCELHEDPTTPLVNLATIAPAVLSLSLPYQPSTSSSYSAFAMPGSARFSARNSECDNITLLSSPSLMIFVPTYASSRLRNHKEHRITGDFVSSLEYDLPIASLPQRPSSSLIVVMLLWFQRSFT